MVAAAAALAMAMAMMMLMGGAVGVVIPVAMRRGVAVILVTVFAAMAMMAVIMAAARAVLVLMSVFVLVAMVVAVGVGAALRLERPGDRGGDAALAAGQFGQHMVLLDVDRVRRDFGRGVPVADVPGEPHQPERVLRADFEQALRGGAHLDQPAVVEPEGVAVGERLRPFEIDQELEPARPGENGAAALARFMV
jgi:hypothetical protein